VAMRQAALVSDESTLEACACSRRCAIQIDDLYLYLCLLDAHAEDALLARMSYSAYTRAMEARLKAAGKLTIRQIIKVAFICSFIVSISYN